VVLRGGKGKLNGLIVSFFIKALCENRGRDEKGLREVKELERIKGKFEENNGRLWEVR
jgi:hypothetical protein